MRKISREELMRLRDAGKVKASEATKVLASTAPKVKEKPKVEKPKVQAVPKVDLTSLEMVAKENAEITRQLVQTVDSLVEEFQVEKKGPLNTKWKMVVTRGSNKLIESIDVEAV